MQIRSDTSFWVVVGQLGCDKMNRVCILAMEALSFSYQFSHPKQQDRRSEGGQRGSG